jgi:nitrate reductase gamma subunit
VAIAIFLAGHVWRYRTDQYGWTTRSTQILESRWLKWGSPLFHLGALAAIGGHVLGILIPTSWTSTAGVSGEAYHAISATAGTIAGVACGAGLLILIYRRMTSPRVRVTTTRIDFIVYALLFVVIGLGLAETLGRAMRWAAATTTARPSRCGSAALCSAIPSPRRWSARRPCISCMRCPPG